MPKPTHRFCLLDHSSFAASQIREVSLQQLVIVNLCEEIGQLLLCVTVHLCQFVRQISYLHGHGIDLGHCIDLGCTSWLCRRRSRRTPWTMVAERKDSKARHQRLYQDVNEQHG